MSLTTFECEHTSLQLQSSFGPYAFGQPGDVNSAPRAQIDDEAQRVASDADGISALDGTVRAGDINQKYPI